MLIRRPSLGAPPGGHHPGASITKKARRNKEGKVRWSNARHGTNTIEESHEAGTFTGTEIKSIREGLTSRMPSHNEGTRWVTHAHRLTAGNRYNADPARSQRLPIAAKSSGFGQAEQRSLTLILLSSTCVAGAPRSSSAWLAVNASTTGERRLPSAPRRAMWSAPCASATEPALPRPCRRPAMLLRRMRAVPFSRKVCAAARTQRTGPIRGTLT